MQRVYAEKKRVRMRRGVRRKGENRRIRKKKPEDRQRQIVKGQGIKEKKSMKVGSKKREKGNKRETSQQQ